ncbi:type VII secretion protein EccE [Amycolatopsis echigonensis]|uniref:Type VII secretion protein EccE n=1 Tax=Amycolatopsis echigonensis TaxID=2576905 RepID=A0A8E1W6D3_9PSEU|nr:type VII secretion protein EccE [Amycolatopsis echigonensis]MBB2504711.1 type VII secretion protein EccE [Amycolatopsis echigonensis]
MSVSAPPAPAHARAPGTAGIPGTTPWPWLLPIRPLQAAGWEIAALALLLAFTVHGLAQPVRITVAALAGLVLVTTSVRVAGRHFAGWAWTWLAHRLRRHDSRRDSPDALLRVAGPVKVRQHVDRAGNRFGVAEVDGDWSAIVRLTPGAGEPSTDDLLAILRTTFQGTDIPLAAVQLLTWAVPREAQVYRVRWLAVRYRPDDAPIAALARGGGELGALRSTASAALSLMVALAEAGYPSTVLEAGELTNELRVALGVSTGNPESDGDFWRAWKWGGLTQTCYSPRSSRGLARTLGTAVPGAAFTATSATLRRTPGGREKLELTIRVGARAEEVPVPQGVSVVPLHGGHGAAVRRTLPLALT